MNQEMRNEARVNQPASSSAAWNHEWPSESPSYHLPSQHNTGDIEVTAVPLPPSISEATVEPRRPRKMRLGLPITVHNQDVLATVLACADNGADVNIMSDDVAKKLGYSEYNVLPERKQFTLANGKIIEAIGQIESVCSFGTETVVGDNDLYFLHSAQSCDPHHHGSQFLGANQDHDRAQGQTRAGSKTSIPSAFRMLFGQAKAFVDLRTGLQADTSDSRLWIRD
jgi:hypothetical protein